MSRRPADAICLPEQLTDLDELAKAIQRRHDAASSSSVVVVAEGALFRGPNGSSEGSAGTMVSVVDEEVDLVSLDEVAAGARQVPATLLEVASRLTVG